MDTVIERVKLEENADGNLTVTMVGEPGKLVDVLVHGIGREALEQILDALNKHVIED